ncbi:MAG: sulfatase-like hydrolase/transferase [Deltaproteobacteria bacterium]|nr:sulfatase-like hydrolase/transferase [Deltaproteobacteria bacterium]
MFLYFATLNIYFRIFVFLINPNNLWHWRLVLQGILQEVVAASFFYLVFRILWILIRPIKLKQIIFFSFVFIWTFINFANYEYVETFNKLLPLSWFPELLNVGSMGPFSDLLFSYINWFSFALVILPLVVSGFIIYLIPYHLFKLKKIRHFIYVFVIGVSCQSGTLQPEIQPMWDSPIHSHLVKYWYYRAQPTPFPDKRTRPLPTFSGHFKQVVLEEDPSNTFLLPKVNRKKPNIVFILLESFRAFDIGVFGSQLGLTPVFDRYAEKGFLFTNLYSSDHLTKTGQWSYLCGAHKSASKSVLRGFRDHGVKCLPDILSEEGYDNWWFHGQSATYDFQGYFMKRHQITHIKDRLTFPSSAKPMGWGLADKDLMDHSLNHLEAAKEPFFWIIQTQSNHHPYEVPPEFDVDRGYPASITKNLNAFRYTDYALGHFLDQFLESPKGKNSLIIIAADHGTGRDLAESERNKKYPTLSKYQIPLLILYPQDQPIMTKKIKILGGQADLMPTLMDILEIPETFPIFGKSLARNYRYRFSKGILGGESWFLTNDKIYITRPSRKLLSMQGKQQKIESEDEKWFQLIGEIDDVQDWMIQKKNSNEIYAKLKEKGWVAN